MKIKEMTATFGKLDKATLRPGEGFTLIQAPNEGGKSTWAAFLRAMLYGFPPRDRDKAGYLAEKNRYQPWSGAAMEGSVTLEWQGREITLCRGPKGTTPWGTFTAVWTATQEPVEELTAENCGEVLLGISREVFERTAFVGQGKVSLSPSADLEKRVAALATSGDEEVSFSQVERKLKDWLNRRRSNRSNGLIPELERSLAETEEVIRRQGTLLCQSQAARQEKDALETQKARLEEQLCSHAAASRALQARRREQAQADYDAALAEVNTARLIVQSLPGTEVLRQAQGDLSYINTLTANLRLAENALPSIREKTTQAEQAAAADPWFGGQDPIQAAAKAQADHDEAVRLRKKASFPLPLLAAPAGTILGILLYRIPNHQPFSLSILILGVLIGFFLVAIPLFFIAHSFSKRAAALLQHYQAQAPEDILSRAAEYNRKVSAVQEARRDLQAVEAERDKLSQQRNALTNQLLQLVHPFAPEVTDLFGVSAALSRALQQGERYTTAEARLEATEKLLSALPSPEMGDIAPSPTAPPTGDPAKLTGQLAAVNVQLARAIDSSARLQGELNSLGDPAEWEAKRTAVMEELTRRREEYAAISSALESLKTADGLLRERFSPAVNQRAGAYLSALTGGKYDKAALTCQFQALAQEAGEASHRQDLTLSSGTAQQLYLAVRLAMCDLTLPQKEPCPILLDDVLDTFDDRRAEQTLECLLEVAQRRQVLLFSCHSREKAMLQGKNAVILEG